MKGRRSAISGWWRVQWDEESDGDDGDGNAENRRENPSRLVNAAFH
jgi:hypothetical protein